MHTKLVAATKIAILVGTRPQIIKMVPLIRELEAKGLDYDVIHTGQHYSPSLSRNIFDSFDLPPATYNLGVGSGGHCEQVGRIIEKLEGYVSRIKLAVITGDTNSAVACALASFISNIPVVHIEAGARSFDMSMPEERNRIVIDRLSECLFAPTMTCYQNLRSEGLAEKTCFTGDVMLDLFLQNSPFTTDILPKLGLESGTYAVLTLHRPFNVDNRRRFHNIIKELEKTGEKYIFPAHPRVPEFVSKNIQILEPLNYRDFLSLVSGASFVVTDSGGLQKEAYWLGKCCFTVRPNTEWPETLGPNVLVNPKELSKEILRCNFDLFKPDLKAFGQGMASIKITEYIKNFVRQGLTK